MIGPVARLVLALSLLAPRFPAERLRASGDHSRPVPAAPGTGSAKEPEETSAQEGFTQVACIMVALLFTGGTIYLVYDEHRSALDDPEPGVHGPSRRERRAERKKKRQQRKQSRK